MRTARRFMASILSFSWMLQPSLQAAPGPGVCPAVDLDPIPSCDASSKWVDPGGSDTNPGTSAQPWRTLTYARANAGSGAVVCVNTGNYGAFTESSPPSIAAAQMFRAAPGQTPELTGISISYASIQPSRLVLSGFRVYRVVTGSAVLVSAVRTQGLRLNGLDVSASKYAKNGAGIDGMTLNDNDDLLVDRCYIHSVFRPILILNCGSPRIINNRLEATAGTPVQYQPGNTAGEIAYNHMYGADYVPYPTDPDAINDPHASIISLRASGVIIRGNGMHGMGSSSAIMTYAPDVTGGEAAYSDILIENNAIYDIENNFALRFNNLGTNVVVRNNTIFNHLRTESCDVPYRYHTALIVENVAAGSGIYLYNNVLAGIVSADASAVAEEKNNIVWSWLYGSREQAVSPSGTSLIITKEWACSMTTYNHLFEDGTFFTLPVDPNWPGRGQHDFSLTSTSLGKNFGDPAFQVAQSLGNVGADGFVEMDGPCRDSARHSAGACEFSSGPADSMPPARPRGLRVRP